MRSRFDTDHTAAPAWVDNTIAIAAVALFIGGPLLGLLWELVA